MLVLPKREEKLRSVCYSNLHVIGLAMMQYAQDNDEVLPRPWFGRDGGPSSARGEYGCYDGNYKWMDALGPYAKMPTAFNCPRDNLNPPYQALTGRSYGSYVMNNAYFAGGDAQSPPSGRSQSEITNPSGTILLLDGENDFQFSWPDAKRTPPIEGDSPFRWNSIRGRHGSGLYQSALQLNCDGSCSTNTLGYARTTRIVNGRKIYPLLTVEDD